MTAPLSQDLRRRLVRAVEAGASAREAVARFEVSASAAIKLVRRARQTGSTAPARIGGYRKPLLDGQEAFPTGLPDGQGVAELAATNPSRTLRSTVFSP